MLDDYYKTRWKHLIWSGVLNVTHIIDHWGSGQCVVHCGWPLVSARDVSGWYTRAAPEGSWGKVALCTLYVAPCALRRPLLLYSSPPTYTPLHPHQHTEKNTQKNFVWTVFFKLVNYFVTMNEAFILFPLTPPTRLFNFIFSFH